MLHRQAATALKHFAIFVSIMALAGGVHAGSGASAVKIFPSDGILDLTLQDNLNTPIYSWPRTLLSYPVDFSQDPLKPEELELVNKTTGQAEPMQLSGVKLRPDGHLEFAWINFFSDLPPGTTRSFELKKGTPASVAGVSDIMRDGCREIDAGKFKVRIPVGGAVHGTEAPGPILALNAGKGWIGGGRVISPVKRIERIDVARTEKGSLFQAYKITYTFTGGGVYEATVRVVWNYDFLEFSEKIMGLNERDRVTFEQAWTGFTPTKRLGAGNETASYCMRPHGVVGIDEPVTTDGIIEDPHWWPADYVEDPSREMIYRLASFEGNGVREAVPVMSFWDDRKGGQELSVFVPDTKGWNDGQYMIWQPTTRLQVWFRFTDGILYWTWPLVQGERRTGIELTDAAASAAAVETVRKIYQQAADKRPNAFEGNSSPKIADFQMRDAQLLRSWYGALNLDRVKDWVLDYPGDARRTPNPFKVATGVADETRDPGTTGAELEASIFHSQLMLYPLGLNLAVMNISHRPVRPMVEQYLKLGDTLTPAQRKRIDALLLLSAYVNSGEDLAPLRTCATGTPNMSADGFCVPTEVSVLFPDHPMASEWRDQFEKAQELEGCFYTRPAVPQWDAKGGRWTESLATYNWAYMVPVLTSQAAISMLGERNRLANPYWAARARWMVDELSAPVFNPDPMWRQTGKEPAFHLNPAWKAGMPLTTEYGFERQFPGHGAHSSGTGVAVPNLIPDLANYLIRYDPLAAEYLFWAYRPVSTKNENGEFEHSPWVRWEMDRVSSNNGTNPHLKSSKYTGHGIVLRAGVDTPDEVSIHLDQVDAGPNYRWGDNGEGASGVIYFFAAGKVWAGHERENTGDHSNDDASGITTYAVLHDKEYRSIGGNVLERPLYDLGGAQFGEITARRDQAPYSWPAYKSRSVLLVGTDYMVITDDAEGPGRFSWFTMRDLPFPKIVFLDPLSTRTDHLTMVQTNISKGILRDSPGPGIVLVTHKGDAVEMEDMTSKPCPVFASEGIREYARDLPKGKVAVEGVYKIRTPGGHDLLFRSTSPIQYDEDGKSLSGKAGVIRNLTDGTTELALFQGSSIGAGGVTLTVPEADETGISARFSDATHLSGSYLALHASTLTLRAPASPGQVFYIDGTRQETTVRNGVLQVPLLAGRHEWELTSRLPKPLPPVIARTENAANWATVFFTPVAGAQKYRIEASLDGGGSWTLIGETSGDHFAFPAPKDANAKIHVRVVALNADQTSDPGNEYPVYFTAGPPLPPDGLFAVLNRDRVDLSWGEILGVTEYRLYRRLKGESSWEKIYSGLARTYSDTQAKGALPPTALPGSEDNVLSGIKHDLVYEYAVSAANGNGEGPKSYVADSDPASWRNWWPAGQERLFKRQTAYWLPPYVSAVNTPPLRYPDK